MDCKELYAQKLMTAAQAAALVKSGDWVDYGWAVNTPVAVSMSGPRMPPPCVPSWQNACRSWKESTSGAAF